MVIQSITDASIFKATIMHCKNCLSPNPPGVSHCTVCRMPGDFGQAEKRDAPVVEQQLLSCTNCGGQAPVQAHKCPSCRWPLPKQEAAFAKTATTAKVRAA